VVVEYFKLKNYYDMLDAQQNNLQTTQIDYLKAKKDIQNGMLGMTEFASISTSYTKAVEAFTKTKNDYYTQFYILKILTGSNLQQKAL
jgi:outer membrane protein TolC